MHSSLSICTFFTIDSLAQTVSDSLSGDDRYLIHQYQDLEAACQFINQEKHNLDCLILHRTPDLETLTNWLYGQATLLPAVIVVDSTTPDRPQVASEPQAAKHASSTFSYHTAEVIVAASDLKEIGSYVRQAIAQFINLSPTSWVKFHATSPQAQDSVTSQQLRSQQQRLTDKLRERLGYLGVYYKRDPQNFFRHLPPAQKQELLATLKTTYREIVLRYFSDDGTLNQRIDDFVNTVFFTDVSAAQVVEIHMELIDEFAKQLKLEGRSEEILLDYRLTLIDTIAHLCEMYRRSIPRES